MKFSLQVIRTFIVSALIFLLGAVIESRYTITNYLPLRIAKNPKTSYQDISGSSLAKLINTDAPSDHKDVDFSTFWQAWNILGDEYNEPDKLNSTKMVDGAIGGMVASLGDPYTTYLPPADKVRSNEDLAGSFYGVGIELGYDPNGVLAVVSPIDGSPAGAANVEGGDLILRVKDKAKNSDESTQGWSLAQAVDKIRGPKGSDVTLTLLRKDTKEPFDVTLQRQEIVVKSVELKYQEQNGKRVAYVKLSRFGERTKSEWDVAVQDILSQKTKIKGIVLDVRNNPGGFFDEAINVASDFIPSGPVVIQKGRFTDKSFDSNGSGRLAKIPLVVLVNGGSASASEIVAGAIHDRLSAKLVGQKTFGKGTVQDVRELKNGGGMHVTIARWMMPSGQWIHEQGIPVDVEVKDDPATPQDEMLQKAIDSL